jgi:hypothetical protein
LWRALAACTKSNVALAVVTVSTSGLGFVGIRDACSG